MLKDEEKWTPAQIQDTAAMVLLCTLFGSIIAILVYFMVLGGFIDPDTGTIGPNDLGDPFIFNVIFWIVIAVLWVIIGYMEFKFGYIYPLQRGIKIQQDCNKSKIFLAGKWRKSQEPPEDFFIGVQYMVPLYFDWDNPQTLLPYSFDVDYKKFAGLLMWDEYVENQEDKTSAAAQEKFIEHLKKRYNEIMKKTPAASKEKEPTPPPEAVSLFPLPKDEEKEDEIDKVVSTPYREFELGDITEEDKAYLKSLYFYFIQFKEEEKFSDSQIGMDCAILILTAPAEKLLDGIPQEARYLGWPVIVPGVDVFIDVIEFITKNMPLGFVVFTEHMTLAANTALEQMTLEAYTFLQLRVLEKWVNHLRKKSTQADLAIKEAEGRAEMFKTAFSDRISEDADNDLMFGRVLKHEMVNRVEQKLEQTQNKFKIAVMALGIIGFIALFLLFLLIGAGTELPADVAPSSVGLITTPSLFTYKHNHKHPKKIKKGGNILWEKFKG